MSRPIITLLTDFGTSDYYVAAMKGVILEINPEAEIVDISHNVLAYDILDAAFTLSQAWSTFPARTVHLVVVDPGVGSQRRPILVSGDRHYFLAPDNGVLSFVYPRLETLTAYHITSEHYFRQPVSSTFHGRDIFAACAAHLSSGRSVLSDTTSQRGSPVSSTGRSGNSRPGSCSSTADGSSACTPSESPGSDIS